MSSDKSVNPRFCCSNRYMLATEPQFSAVVTLDLSDAWICLWQISYDIGKLMKIRGIGKFMKRKEDRWLVYKMSKISRLSYRRVCFCVLNFMYIYFFFWSFILLRINRFQVTLLFKVLCYYYFSELAFKKNFFVLLIFKKKQFCKL